MAKLKICRIARRLAWRRCRFLMMATGTYTETATHVCVFTAFSVVPKNDLIRRCCLIHSKNSSTRHRQRWRSAMVDADNEKLLVRKTTVLSVLLVVALDAA